MELRIARKIAGLTQQELADKAGVEVSTISLIESGKRDIRHVRFPTVMKLARALHVEPHELFPILLEDDPPPGPPTTDTDLPDLKRPA